MSRPLRPIITDGGEGQPADRGHALVNEIPAVRGNGQAFDEPSEVPPAFLPKGLGQAKFDEVQMRLNRRAGACQRIFAGRLPPRILMWKTFRAEAVQ